MRKDGENTAMDSNGKQKVIELYLNKRSRAMGAQHLQIWRGIVCVDFYTNTCSICAEKSNESRITYEPIQNTSKFKLNRFRQ